MAENFGRNRFRQDPNGIIGIGHLPNVTIEPTRLLFVHGIQERFIQRFFMDLQMLRFDKERRHESCLHRPIPTFSHSLGQEHPIDCQHVSGMGLSSQLSPTVHG